MKTMILMLLLVGIGAACGEDSSPDSPADMAQDEGNVSDTGEADMGEEEDLQDDVGQEDMAEEEMGFVPPVVWIEGDINVRATCDAVCAENNRVCEVGAVFFDQAGMQADYEGDIKILDDCDVEPEEVVSDFNGNQVNLLTYECRCVP